MEEEEPMRLNLEGIYHYIKLAYFSYAYTGPGEIFADLSHMLSYHNMRKYLWIKTKILIKYYMLLS